MMRRPRRNPRPAFKAKGARGAIREEPARAERAQQFAGQPKQIKQWKEQLLAGVPAVFDSGGKQATASESDVPAGHAKMGQLTLENDFFEGARSKAGLLPRARR